jgi:hypothetical protein
LWDGLDKGCTSEGQRTEKRERRTRKSREGRERTTALKRGFKLHTSWKFNSGSRRRSCSVSRNSTCKQWSASSAPKTDEPSVYLLPLSSVYVKNP